MQKTQHKPLTILKLGGSVFTEKTYVLKQKADAISRDRVTISIHLNHDCDFLWIDSVE